MSCGVLNFSSNFSQCSAD